MKSHRIMNKWWHYFEIYETFLHRYANSEVRFLEIGVFRGGSMQMWRDYFGEKATIVGIDIDDIDFETNYKTNIYSYSFHYYNFSYFPQEMNNIIIFYYACQYDYYEIVENFLNSSKIDLNKIIICIKILIKFIKSIKIGF